MEEEFRVLAEDTELQMYMRCLNSKKAREDEHGAWGRTLGVTVRKVGRGGRQIFWYCVAHSKKSVFYI